ncbi:hypothetical protein ERO13_A08G119133v2 [Gossypium hirsutum]|uniref:Uncharacterized protein n=4 Tax=Gossypium TaxID=3633 RepID=A0A2P5Y7S0_GOSBA|nr:uncharacterized protein LOC107926884 [Gossypium hirsutum]KAB2070014.1 hypothetical protein ES319_A08G129600v1 [Gossypium barbadense]TYH06250.1 hypothetical protein ES288_A08G141700v1 [Gossypium darwinii]TYI14747.1 hypothetical protein ES332_A08G141600v1 [Gossypium tomentosum]KAG4187724.1 hypothetical protein ERO13_A08G119133v2 [Gossypium hirsutum]PPS11635.1 hypothetical protein GOBAR_AA09014 [Gossypium barbadense]
MGNYISTATCFPSDSTGKVILWDGTVQEFGGIVEAAELMVEHPQQVVVEFNAGVHQKRLIPLPADHKLDVKKLYIMLPMKRGQPIALSSEEACRVLSSANSVSRSKSILSSSPKCVPLFARICTADYRVLEGMGQKLQLQKKESAGGERPEESGYLTELFPESWENPPVYLNRQFSGKGWKPSLDTIKEKKVEREFKIPHWLF